MTFNPRKSPAVFSTLFACALLLLISLLPVWRPRSNCSMPGTLWEPGKRLLRELQNGPAAGMSSLDVLSPYRQYFAEAALLYAVGLVAGRALYWLLWEWDRPGR
jgi:hypothetical protein